ncbi:stage VI sporulation protein D [Bacillota bacterium Lsc_1132]
MSQENQSCLRFSLEESLWFRKGQEVEELISISLDPDITIQENDQYVTIRGSLELTGEYKSFSESKAEEEETESAQKYVQRVDEHVEGICEFSHRFPVDITIPNNRIQSIYDIDVMVETFDYSLPERSCLKLSADLTISGLYGARQNETAEAGDLAAEIVNRTDEYPFNEAKAEEQGEGEGEGEAAANEEAPLFVVEARKQQEEESSKEAIVTYPTFSYQPDEQTTMPPEFSQPADLSQPFRSEEKAKIEVIAEEKEVEEAEEIEIEEKEIDEESSSSSSSEQGPASKLVDAIKKKATKKKSMSLTEFFARKEDRDEHQAKLKICIVQKGDTLDQIAERYDVTFQNLLRVNRLDVNQDVYEGQVLYIPVALAKN